MNVPREETKEASIWVMIADDDPRSAGCLRLKEIEEGYDKGQARIAAILGALGPYSSVLPIRVPDALSA